MQPLTLQEIIRAMEGRPDGKPPTLSIASVGTDSRQVRPGELFFALAGERFDAHCYVGDVLEAGAAAAVVERVDDVPAKWRGTGRLIVADRTRAALGRLARYHREQNAATVIGVVGSNGKTTTKAMIDGVLSARRRGRAAVKSFNNDVGVPLTLLSAESSDEYLVVEIGTNAPGEVAALADIARPDIAVLTSIGEEHLEFFGSLDGVAEEECAVFSRVRPGGLAVVHADAAERAAAASDARLNRVTFGRDAKADVRASDIEMSETSLRFRVNERFDYTLPMIGPHNAVNALAAIAVGLRFKMEHAEIAAALLRFTPPPMRMEIVRRRGVTIINDAYNANPTSLQAGLDTLDAWPGGGRKVLLIGDMHELGAQAERCHAAMGRAASRSKAELVIAVGRWSEVLATAAAAAARKGVQVIHFGRRDDAARAMTELLARNDVVLLKGSRASGMEQLIEAIPDSLPGAVPRGKKTAAVRPSTRRKLPARRAGKPR